MLKCLYQIYLVIANNGLLRLFPKIHHRSHASNRISLQSTNCLRQILRVFGYLITTIIPGSKREEEEEEMEVEKDRSPTRKFKTSDGLNKQTNPNHEPSAAAQSCCRSQPSTLQPSLNKHSTNPSIQKAVMGIRDLTGFNDLHPWMALHVFRNMAPDTFKLRCNPKTPRVTQYNLSPFLCASSTKASNQRSNTWGEVWRLMHHPLAAANLNRNKPASRRLLRYDFESPTLWRRTIPLLQRTCK